MFNFFFKCMCSNSAPIDNELETANKALLSPHLWTRILKLQRSRVVRSGPQGPQSAEKLSQCPSPLIIYSLFSCFRVFP